MNVGLFGGTFNPIHKGHIEVITFVKSGFNLDVVYIIPSAVPPHKTQETLAPATIRFEMVQRAVLDISGIIVSNVELMRKGRSFSIDTIKHFRDIIGDNAKLFFVMGSDVFFDIDTWKNSVEIFKLANIIVMQRAGETRNLNDIESFLQKIISPFYKASLVDNALKHNDLNHSFKTVHICNVPEINISSTLIREKIKKCESITGYVPPSVESMILERKLYL